jgi:PEP-CTERM motif
MRSISMLTKVGIASVLTGSMAAAFAAPTFTIDPSSLGVLPFPAIGSPTVVGDAFSTSGNTRAVLSDAFGTSQAAPGIQKVDGAGYITFDTVKLNNVTVPGFGVGSGSGLGINWSMFATFTFSMQLLNGGLGNPGSDYLITNLSMNLYAESLAGANSTYTAGDVNSNPMIGLSGDTKLIGTGTIDLSVGDGFGIAGISGIGGSFFNPTMEFALSNPDGPLFFTAPDPFFKLAFASLTNDIGQITRDLADREIYLATGGTASFTNPVPEPESLALVGIALLGAGVAARRQLRK